MKLRLIDTNVWLALLAPRHRYHSGARNWFDSLGAREAGLCRVVQLALLRLLGNRTILGDGAISAAQAWVVLRDVMEEERVEFVAEPPGLGRVLPSLFRDAIPTPALVPNAYLAAFAIAGSRTLVTRDRGFAQFRGLDVEFLED